MEVKPIEMPHLFPNDSRDATGKGPHMSNPVVSPEELAKLEKLDVKKGRLRLKTLYKTYSLVMHNLKASKREGLEALREQYYTKLANLFDKLDLEHSELTEEELKAEEALINSVIVEKALVCGMHADAVSRRADTLRRELRHIHLARAFNFGVPYRSVEANPHVGFGINPEPSKIVDILREHVPAFKSSGNRGTDKMVFREQVVRVQEWLKGEDKVVINTTHGYDADGNYV